jgi:hypothetical protein
MGKIWGSVVFPGLGHLLSGRYAKGVVIAVMFGITVEVLLASMVWPEALEGLEPEFMGLAMIIWGYGVLSHWWLLSRGGKYEAAGDAEQIMLAGIQAMLREDLKGAEEAFRTVLRLNDRDVEGWLYLARTCQLEGKEAQARKFYRVVKRLDRAGKWAWELDMFSGASVATLSDATH